MKFLTGSLRDISEQFGVMLILACAFLLSSCATSYASTKTPISNQPTTLQTKFSEQSKNLFQTAGSPPERSRRSIERLNQFTNFTGFETQPFSVTNLRSNYAWAAQTREALSSSVISITSISLSSLITQASRCAHFSLKDISKTARLCSVENRRTSLRTSAVLPERNLKILPTGKRIPLFAPPFSERATGRTSAVFPRRESNWLALSPHSTRGQPKSAAS